VWAHNSYERFSNALAEALGITPDHVEFQPGGRYHTLYHRAAEGLLEPNARHGSIREDFLTDLAREVPYAEHILTEDIQRQLWTEAQPNADLLRQAQIAAMYEDGHLSPAAIRASKNDPDFFLNLGLIEPTAGWEYHTAMVEKAKNNLGVPGTVKVMERWFAGPLVEVSVHYHRRPQDSPHFGEPVAIKVKEGWTWGND